MKRIIKFREKIKLDAGEGALISSQINTRYLSRLDYTDGYILVLPERAYLLADFRYIEIARKTLDGRGFEVIMPESTMPMEILSLCAENKINRLYIEENDLSCSAYKRMCDALEGVTLMHGASAALSELRAVKDADEIEKITRAQRITDAAFEHILKLITPHMTEREVALELEFFMRRQGSEGVAFDTIAVSGSASSMPHGEPRDLPLERGFLTMDFGARIDGYCADMTRTVVIGRADAEMKRLYNTVLAAQRAALDFICEGVLCRDADSAARNIIYGAGYEGCFGHSLGHGVGMLVHEEPRLSQSAGKNTLVTGNVVTVEPGIYIAGKYGCRIEDMVAIEKGGNIANFTKSTKELIEI